MWQIRLYDQTHFWNDDHHLMDLLKKTEQEPPTDSILIIEGKTYSWCAKSPAGKVLAVKEISLKTDPEDECYGDLKCPFCGSVDNDAWERTLDTDTIECGNCGSEIEYEREFTVTYNVSPVKMNKVVNL